MRFIVELFTVVASVWSSVVCLIFGVCLLCMGRWLFVLLGLLFVCGFALLRVACLLGVVAIGYGC